MAKKTTKTTTLLKTFSMFHLFSVVSLSVTPTGSRASLTTATGWKTASPLTGQLKDGVEKPSNGEWSISFILVLKPFDVFLSFSAQRTTSGWIWTAPTRSTARFVCLFVCIYIYLYILAKTGHPLCCVREDSSLVSRKSWRQNKLENFHCFVRLKTWILWHSICVRGFLLSVEAKKKHWQQYKKLW